MKHIILLVAFIILFQPLAIGQIEGTQFKQALISKEAELHYVFSNAPGFSDYQRGRLVGICLDIMADFEFFLLDKYGIRVKTINHKEFAYDFPAFMHAVETSRFGVFGLSNVTKTAEREIRFQFSPPVIKNYVVMLTDSSVKDLSDIGKISDEFNGFKAVTVKGSTNEIQLQNIKEAYFPSMKIEYVQNFNEVLKRVSQGERYFTIMDFIYLLEAQKKSLPIKEHKIGVQNTEELAIILPKDTDWNIPLNKFLTEEYRMSPSYRKIITRYLGVEALHWLDEMNAIEALRGH